MKYNKVGVLLGGQSSEREVSLNSGHAVSKGLQQAGFEVVEIDVGANLDEQLRRANIEAAYIALHGKLGEDGTVQGMLEVMRIPYTGSSVTASAVAMDKVLTRILLQTAGLNVAPGFVTKKNTPQLPKGFAFPLVVKPAADGSSVGVSIAKSQSSYQSGLDAAFDIAEEVLVEQFTAGAEVQVAVLDGEVLGSVEIEPNREFYDYEAKYTEGGAVHHIPPRLSQSQTETCHRLGKAAFDTLKCAGLCRIDLIVPKDGAPIILEVNTIPGMTEFSLAPEIAAHAGISFDQLVRRVMEGARLHINL